ncbi:hypothetical protein AB0J82_22715 [Asanoa sp. NPDC049518]|uniref:hypothetical protein n=1 Tax=unclassified Asanoa TaxID=2685164 RepID=UPI0034294633
MRPTLQVTYRALSPVAARAFALLGSLCAVGVRTAPEWTVSALLGSGATEASAAVEELLDARLLEPVGVDQVGVQRYAFHELTRLYALERREAEISDADWAAAFGRAAAGWLGLVRLARERLQCERFHLEDAPETPEENLHGGVLRAAGLPRRLAADHARGAGGLPGRRRPSGRGGDAARTG